MLLLKTLSVICLISMALSDGQGELDGNASVDWTVANSTVAFTLTVTGNQWVAFGVNPTGEMTGSDAFLCLPGNNEVRRVHITAKSASGLVDQSVQPTGATVSQTNDMTTCVFSRELTGEADPNAIDINADEATTFVYAYGSSNDLAYHGNSRGSATFTLNDSEGSAASCFRTELIALITIAIIAALF